MCALRWLGAWRLGAGRLRGGTLVGGGGGRPGPGRGTRVSSNVLGSPFRWGPTRLIIAGTVVTTWALNTETATTYVEQPPFHVDCGDSTVRHSRPPRYPRRRSQLDTRMVDFASNPSHVPNTTLLRAPAPPPRSAAPPRPSGATASLQYAQHDASTSSPLSPPRPPARSPTRRARPARRSVRRARQHVLLGPDRELA